MSPLLRCLRFTVLAAALLAPSVAPAQRRVITPGGGNPAPTEVKPEGQKDGPAAPVVENKEEASSETAKPPEGKKDEPKAVTQPATKKEEATAPRTPIGEPARKEVPPAPPVVLVPKDELESPKAGAAKTTAVAPKVDEVLYRKKVERTSVTLRVRPAAPVPGRTTTLLFEVVKHLAVPDPALGDRVPLENAVLFVTIGRDGAGSPVRYRLRALPDAGIYGVHYTAKEAGPYRLQLEQRLENAEIGDKALTTEFVLGIGQETAMQAAEEEAAVKTGKGRTALRAGAEATEGAGPPIRVLGEAWLELSQGLQRPGAAGDLVATARAASEAAARIAGQAPAALSSQRREFDALAADLLTGLKDLPALVGADAGKAKELMTTLETQSCARCHVKYRFQIADDVSAWPKFTPRAPQETSSGPRKPTR
ncbi:MAG: hypothetical protein HY901_24020 [Deltaproteobacteria bacterium]|nr:hypothetical protein [Deltaproteobacteria bacterium]